MPEQANPGSENNPTPSVDEDSSDDGESEDECDCNNIDCNECYEDASDWEDSPVRALRLNHSIKPGEMKLSETRDPFHRRKEVAAESPKPEPQPLPREPLWTHLAQSHKMEAQAVGTRKEMTMEELEEHRRAYWGDTYDAMVASGTLTSLENIYKRYQAEDPLAQPLEDTNQSSDILEKMRNQILEIRESRLQTQECLDYIDRRLRQIHSATSNLTVVMRLNQDSAHPDNQEAQVMEEENEQSEPTPPNDNCGSEKAEMESGKRTDPPAEIELSPKRARMCSAPTRPSLNWEQDAMED